MLKKYDSSSIKVLKGLDAVRKRPGMYIGDTDSGNGLHRMVFELVDNSIDESLEGFCSNIKVILHLNNSVTVIDDGRGIPVDIHKDEGKPAVEVIMTVLHSGGKFDDNSYKVSGGLHGVGVSVVNALSENLSLKIFKNGYVYEQSYSFGIPKSNLIITGKSNKTGTEITFLADKSIFKEICFDYNFLLKRLRELSFLNSNLKIILLDERYKEVKEDILLNKGGLVSFVKFLNTKKNIVNKDIIYFTGISNDINIDICIQWIESYKENIYCYTNNIYQQDGGAHLIGFKASLTKVFKQYINSEGLNKNNFQISGEDIRNGITVVLSLKMKNPKFSSQTKDKLISLEAKNSVEAFLSARIKDFLYENPVISRVLSNRIVILAKSRDAAKKARELIRKKESFEILSLPGKLADCRESNPKFSELFLVEGDSAGGSAKQARDRLTQAILPLKGKILNVEKSGFEKLILSSEIGTLINVLGCGIGLKDYDISKLRYHKIIFMTDADIDGAHIRTLLLTFFYRQLPKIIENGHIYIAQPPLYKLYRNDFIKYIQDEKSYNIFIFDLVIETLLDKYKNSSFITEFDLLKEILYLYRDFVYVVDDFSLKFPRIFLENLLLFNKFIDDFNFNSQNFITVLNEFELYLNSKMDLGYKFNLEYVFLNKSYFIRIKFFRYGIYKEYDLDLSFFKSNAYLIFKELKVKLKNFFLFNKTLVFNNVNYNIETFNLLINNVLFDIKKKYKIQRYKGLGEMNPNQLWETTMNPETRILNLIKITDAKLADKKFSDLMGDNIVERKKFIYNHALSIKDLDL